MTVENIVYGTVGAILGGIIVVFFIWLLALQKKTNEMYKAVSNFPTPVQFAKELMKVKLPMEEMPPEAIENMKQMYEEEQAKQKDRDKKLPTNKSTYIG